MIVQKVNINDIAIKTGLSISTVSRVLNGKAEQFRIGKKSQQKIYEAAKELNYIPNQFAANIRTGKSNTIALIVPSLNNPFFADLTSNINAEIRKYGYTTMIGDSDENVDIEKMELQQMTAMNVDGLIIAPCNDNPGQIKQLYDQGLQHSAPNKLRVKGFKDAMEEAGLDQYLVIGDDFSIQNGYLETRLLLHQKKMPSAIFALSNTIALGCMKALKEMNFRIPDDISLITFDDHQYLEFLETPLSCVAQPVHDISKIAVKFLFSQINKEGDKDNIRQILLKPQLKLKISVKRN
jgi:LacI family transcriptional regulator